jgi:hypothetical protein
VRLEWTVIASPARAAAAARLRRRRYAPQPV